MKRHRPSATGITLAAILTFTPAVAGAQTHLATTPWQQTRLAAAAAALAPSSSTVATGSQDMTLGHIMRRAAAQSIVVGYSVPDGVNFAGPDEHGQSLGDYVFAPAGTFLSTKAKCTAAGALYAWDYETTDLHGTTSQATSLSQQISFRLSAGLHKAPVVTAGSGDLTATYCMAADGIYAGEGYKGHHFSVNYHPALTPSYDISTDALTLNSSEANSTMDYLWSGVGISDFYIHAFAETFTYAAPYYLEAVSAEVYCPTTVNADDIEAHIVRREGNSPSADDIVRLNVQEVTKLNVDGRYLVTFVPAEETRITSAVMVRVGTPEGSGKQISIVYPVSRMYNSDDTAVSSLYADFSIAGKPVKRQYLDFSGIELTDDSGKATGYLNNFCIGLRKSYTPGGISGIAQVCGDDGPSRRTHSIYTIDGRYAGPADRLGSLPKGIYIIDGKKTVK